MSWEEVGEVLAAVRANCRVEDLTIHAHDRGREVARRYGLSVDDAMTVATALQAGARILYPEDMQDGQPIDGVTTRNPFRRF